MKYGHVFSMADALKGGTQAAVGNAQMMQLGQQFQQQNKLNELNKEAQENQYDFSKQAQILAQNGFIDQASKLKQIEFNSARIDSMKKTDQIKMMRYGYDAMKNMAQIVHSTNGKGWDSFVDMSEKMGFTKPGELDRSKYDPALMFKMSDGIGQQIKQIQLRNAKMRGGLIASQIGATKARTDLLKEKTKYVGTSGGGKKGEYERLKAKKKAQGGKLDRDDQERFNRIKSQFSREKSPRSMAMSAGKAAMNQAIRDGEDAPEAMAKKKAIMLQHGFDIKGNKLSSNQINNRIKKDFKKEYDKILKAGAKSWTGSMSKEEAKKKAKEIIKQRYGDLVN